MSLTVGQIVNHAITLNGGSPIDMMLGRRFINEFMEILAEKYESARVKDTVTINCTDILIDYPLPDECLGVLDVKDSKNNKINANNYTATKFGDVNFDDVGAYTVVYVRSGKLPDRNLFDVKLPTDIPEINQAFHRSISYYVAAMTLPASDPKMLAYINDSNNLAENANRALNNMKKKQRRIKSPRWV